MATWCQLGFRAGDFWRETPRTMLATLDGAAAGLKRAHEGRVWLAYHIAVMMRAEKPPTFEELLGKPKRQLSMLEKVQSIAARTAGIRTTLARWEGVTKSDG